MTAIIAIGPLGVLWRRTHEMPEAYCEGPTPAATRACIERARNLGEPVVHLVITAAIGIAAAIVAVALRLRDDASLRDLGAEDDRTESMR